MAEKLAKISRFELGRLEGQVNCLFAMVTRVELLALASKRNANSTRTCCMVGVYLSHGLGPTISK